MTMLTGMIGGGAGGGGSVTFGPYGNNPGVLLSSGIWNATNVVGDPLIAIGSTGFPASGEVRDGMAQTEAGTDYFFGSAPLTFNGVTQPFPSILLWTSPAGANTWTYVGVAIPFGSAGAWNGGGVFSPSKPLKVGGKWKMLVSGVVNTDAYWVGPDTKIGVYVATSLAGPWTEQAGNPVIIGDQTYEGQQGPYSPSVVAAPGGGYIINYCGRTPANGFTESLATSPDLVTFTKQGQATLIGPGAIGSLTDFEEPALVLYSGLFWNIVAGLNALVSADGYHWMGWGNIAVGSATWNAGGVGTCDVITNADNSLNIVYNGFTTGVRSQVGAATCPAFVTMGPSHVADVPAVLAATNTYSIGSDSTGTQYGQIPGAAVSFAGSYGLMCWVRRNAATKYTDVFSKKAATDNSKTEYDFFWEASIDGTNPNKLAFGFTPTTTGFSTLIGTATHAQTGDWHAVCVNNSVAAGNSSISLFFDTIADGSATYAGVPTQFGCDVLTLRNNNVGVSNNAQAQVCELLFRSGSVFTQTEINNFYNSGTIPSNVIRYKCDEPSGHVLIDQTAMPAVTPSVALPPRPVCNWLVFAGFCDGVGGGPLTDLTGNVNPGTTNFTLVNNALNGWPIVRNANMQMHSAINQQNLCYFAVLKPTAAGIIGGYQSIVSNQSGTGTDYQIVQTAGVPALTLNQTTALGSANTPLSTSSFTFAMVTFNSPNGAFFNNGNADGTFNHAQAFTFTKLYLGETDAGQAFHGDIAMIGQCSNDSATINSVKAFCRAAFNLTIN